MSLYHFAKTVVWYVLKPLYRMEVSGQENIPSEGPVIVCANHISNLDPPLVGGSIKREMFFIAKEELFEKKWLARLLSRINVFPIKRGMSDRQAIRKALGLLKDDRGLVIFPEGTRSKTGQLGKGLSGVGFFALRSKATVVPCAIIGPYKIGKKVRIVYGQPLDLTHLREEKKDVKEVTQHIMASIKQLIENNQ
ncbi:1-acyl-sn-glycerol-3-phosphate acyltransferase [Halolactibacillus alkaliphilus]|uniref:1-acyl-sn-glycerol-3-phosphate acyltransferase n=1 Tax=Halolactibacillus alkaliphilus TaxID=442899 RepID=A0A511X174_9BACI|nr:lysophospholipid acyltransferase family protein [Halolactibacillus alkaliphilus]GEN56699.1 1-acyl-sn-glycerol-3-phosphate acyltransferase [Halolactibacillus alkaliphilus]GGN70071.1 1-acyl-sn-glycerol-3-phosphate acyltransferase [Halolactibacillus alkaliphilus]SFO77898.1 1-acyl-sn-glycerol-3-phosphate acyltransferase [Halolactibacillus alkaliphilus]